MSDADGYLSRDRKHLARLQRARRASMTRIDYMPGREALGIFQARRARAAAGTVEATNSAVLDAILIEWARLSGIKKGKVEPSMSPAFADQYAQARMTPDAERSARTQESGASTGISGHIAGAHPRAYDSGEQGRWQATRRVICGAKRHRDGQSCRAKSEPGKRRCRFHGGCSTGPRTPEGKARALANLRRGKDRS